MQAALVFLQSFCTLQAQKAGKTKQGSYQLPFYFHVFGFCTCANIKQVPGYKETDPDVQFTCNYPDNWVSIPALKHILLQCFPQDKYYGWGSASVIYEVWSTMFN